MQAVVDTDRCVGSTELETAADVFMALRPRLFGIAYRMLNAVVDAEDAVQDVWLRWQTVDRDGVRDATAFLVTMTTRVCINALGSAYTRREIRTETTQCEMSDAGADPSSGVEQAETLHAATLHLMARLTPPEYAAYILREAFDYPHGLIAATLDVTDVNARQLVSRARRRLASKHHGSVDAADHERLHTAFVAAAQDGNMAGLERVLGAAAGRSTRW